MNTDLKTLVLMVGWPRSGKTTWARQSGLPIVNPDSIRLAIHGHRFIPSAEPLVWATAKIMVAALFTSGHSTVVLDATNLSRARRREWYSTVWECRYKYIDTPVDECIRRAEEVDDQEIISVIRRMMDIFDPLGPDEVLWGF